MYAKGAQYTLTHINVIYVHLNFLFVWIQQTKNNFDESDIIYRDIDDKI